MVVVSALYGSKIRMTAKKFSNGGHVYQLYKAGFRPLNDASALHTASLTTWLTTAVPSGTIQSAPPAQTASYSRGDCRGYIPDSTWCLLNCPCVQSSSC